MDFSMEKFDIIIEGGQSNASGSGKGPVSTEYVKDLDILYLVQDFTSEEGILNGIWKIILNYENKPLHIDVADERVNAEGKLGDFALTFSKKYKESGLLKKGRKLLIVRAGVGGTGFVRKYWGPNDEVYLKMLEMIDYALSLNKENRIVAFLWHQGEHDAWEGNTPENYASQLRNLIDSVKARYSVPNLPFVSGDFAREWKAENIEKCAPIIEVIKRVTADVGGRFVETDDLTTNNEVLGNGDGIHFSRESLHILGKRYFDAFFDIISG